MSGKVGKGHGVSNLRSTDTSDILLEALPAAHLAIGDDNEHRPLPYGGLPSRTFPPSFPKYRKVKRTGTFKLFRAIDKQGPSVQLNLGVGIWQ